MAYAIKINCCLGDIYHIFFYYWKFISYLIFDVSNYENILGYNFCG